MLWEHMDSSSVFPFQHEGFLIFHAFPDCHWLFGSTVLQPSWPAELEESLRVRARTFQGIARGGKGLNCIVSGLLYGHAW